MLASIIADLESLGGKTGLFFAGAEAHDDATSQTFHSPRSHWRGFCFALARFRVNGLGRDFRRRTAASALACVR
jgi:hypothetical protein